MNVQQSAVAKSSEEARVLITTSVAKTIELDFECSPSQFFEIAHDSRKYGVSVFHRQAEMILVESFKALKRGLFEPKDTFRQRHLVCCFDLKLAPIEELKDVEARAVEIGDLILPEQSIKSPYTQWAN